MARYILTPLGGVGDINPFIWVARLLLERGHAVRVLGASKFEESFTGAGLDFKSVSSEAEASDFFLDPDLNDAVKGPRLLRQFGSRILHEYYDAICLALMVESAVLVTPPHHLAARAVQEKYRVPTAVVHIQPSWSRNEHLSVAQPRREDWLLEPALGMGWGRWGYSGCVTAAIAPALRKFCDDIEVRVPRQRLRAWSHPPDLSLMLFPEWFTGSMTSAPANSVFDGFPLPELAGESGMAGELRSFFEAGDMPVLLTLENTSAGSAAFFETALRACGLLGLRAFVVTGRADLLPHPLPSWVRVSGHLPSNRLFPRFRAVVHDGGIGTLSQCLAAGVPQLISPSLPGQQGNASRLRWLGAGDSLIPAQFSVGAVASLLHRLTSAPPVKATCDSLRDLCQRRPAGAVAREALEALARQRWSGAAVGGRASRAGARSGVLLPS